jgi:fermentation-respiration switch protein FrsA (DUF1100 family)
LDRFIEASIEQSPGWKNEVTIRSVEFFGEYEPESLAPFVSPTPLLMIVGAKDVVNPAGAGAEAVGHTPPAPFWDLHEEFRSDIRCCAEMVLAACLAK